jgi:hypothetical protein
MYSRHTVDVATPKAVALVLGDAFLLVHIFVVALFRILS